MARTVRDAGADIGICLDGDADRLILSDEKGTICDGDQILAALALDMQSRGSLQGPVIGTVMSNLGLERCLADAGIAFERAPVGDRYIAQRMQETGSQLGGEPSGHILLPELTRTGDGLIAALQIPGHNGPQWQESVTDFIELYPGSTKTREFKRYG